MPLRKGVALVTATVALVVGCGKDKSLDASQLPPSLAESIPRLERAGYSVEAVSITEANVPALIVREGAIAAVFARMENRDVPLVVRGEGDPVPVHGFDICQSGITIMYSTKQQGETAREMARAGRLCDGGSGGSPAAGLDEIPETAPPPPWAAPPEDPPN